MAKVYTKPGPLCSLRSILKLLTADYGSGPGNRWDPAKRPGSRPPDLFALTEIALSAINRHLHRRHHRHLHRRHVRRRRHRHLHHRRPRGAGIPERLRMCLADSHRKGDASAQISFLILAARGRAR